MERTQYTSIEKAYEIAKEMYASYGVDTDQAITQTLAVPLSLHCWQGDDVVGFEGSDSLSGGGILATGNYPGRARNGDELRQDASFAFSLIPGKKRFNLHAMYAETGGKKIDRDELEPEHFKKWIDWAQEQQIALDFNPTFFSHPKASSGYTLAHADTAIRKFWIRHGKACRRIAAYLGKTLNEPCIDNIWIPDGSKDLPLDRLGPRQRLLESLNEILQESYPAGHIIDTVESKLFGIGSEAYVVGSHEFYMGYAVQRQIGLCLDMGHFHPTETIHDKISALSLFVPTLLLHISRGIRWDSDHVVLYSDDVRDVCRAVVRANLVKRVAFALDFFDASINRIVAWVIGARSFRLALLEAFLEPVNQIRKAESEGKLHERLALMEEAKTLPFTAVWDYLCYREHIPNGPTWRSQVERYEREVLSHRR
ncbi:MAG TPA: L-rhamnose isomerase [Termitinemataceae bacterium]|nr:L-rhamnose isomerase [Termitinemataceae bacterium]HOM24238.1 L-rhamnose isomerase [Termitinemataceae bacterium]HPQ01319.1 L-rhamnose isomerase [Termitinemataceae bacterium]